MGNLVSAEGSNRSTKPSEELWVHSQNSGLCPEPVNTRSSQSSAVCAVSQQLSLIPALRHTHTLMASRGHSPVELQQAQRYFAHLRTAVPSNPHLTLHSHNIPLRPWKLSQRPVTNGTQKIPVWFPFPEEFFSARAAFELCLNTLSQASMRLQ